MTLILKNRRLSLQIAEPGELYRGSRFDWTGQIMQITFDGRHTFCTREVLQPSLDDKFGCGLFNEFGIDEPVGYDDCPVGETFPKIGIGLLVKDSDDPYDFFHPYEVLPCRHELEQATDKIVFHSTLEPHRGYGYRLSKSLTLGLRSLTLRYQLENIGTHSLITNEYVHNFLAIDDMTIGPGYELSFPFLVNVHGLSAAVNPEEAVRFDANKVGWTKQPTEQFFFSDIDNGGVGPASFALAHPTAGMGISETLSHACLRINLWGTTHVVSPEIIHKLSIPPGGTHEWQRKYELYTLEEGVTQV